jgi:uncharacterized protein (TIGR00251 family)
LNETGAHFRWAGDDLLLDLKGKPGARRDAFGRVMQGRLSVHIAAVAADGQATARLLAFLAEAFGVPRSAVELVYGQASVHKQVRVRSPRRLPPAAGVTPHRS